MSSAALVATTEQDEPASPRVKVDPTTEHDPDDTEYETAPTPDPPLVVTDNADPYVPVVDVIASALCATREIVSGAETYEMEYRFALPAFSAAEGVMV